MSIRLLQSIFIAGVLSPVDGSTLSLPAALEADLVNQGRAVWVAAPELTASELAHASAHARMRQPNGVPIILAQSAIPMILPSSGTMGANGALTGLTALPFSVFPQPCFMYFPAGKVFSGSPAGMYYASITAATTATVYNNMYTSGSPQNAIPLAPTPVVDAGPGAYTQSSDVAIVSIVVPGGMIGSNGSLRATSRWNMTNNANSKSLKQYFGGAAAGLNNAANSLLCTGFAQTMRNRGSLSSQLWPGYSSETAAATVDAPLTAINTAVDQTFSFGAAPAVPTDNVLLVGFTVEVLPG